MAENASRKLELLKNFLNELDFPLSGIATTKEAINKIMEIASIRY